MDKNNIKPLSELLDSLKDIEGFPILEGEDGRVFLEFQGYKDQFIRHRLLAKINISGLRDRKIPDMYSEPSYIVPERKPLKS